MHQHKHDAGDFFTTALDHSSPSLSEHHITPHARSPPPIACIVGDWVDLAISAWELVNDNDRHDNDDDEDDDAAVAADVENDGRRRRQPIFTIINLSRRQW